MKLKMFTLSKRNMHAIIFFLIFYIMFGVYLTITQEHIVYQPNTQDFMVCPAFSETEKVVMNGTRMYVEHGERGIVVLYHGNAGSACDRAFYADFFRRSGYGFAIVEYAGYSNGSQKPSHERVREDVQNVLSFLETQAYTRVLVVGESLGTGVAGHHVAHSAPEAVLLITPFLTLPHEAQRLFWYYPARYMVKNAFDNTANFRSYQGKVTIVHGEGDKIILIDSARMLYETLGTNDKTFVSVEGVGHNDLFFHKKTQDALEAFLN